MTAKKATATQAVKAFVLIDRDGTKKLIDGIRKAGSKLDRDIQTALQCSAIHSHTCGDYTLLEALLLAMPKGVRSNAVKAWMMQYAPVGFVAGKMAFQRSYDVKDEAARQAAIKAVETATDWTEFKPEPEFVPFDFSAGLTSILKRAETALMDPEHKGQHKVTPEQVAELKRLLANMA